MFRLANAIARFDVRRIAAFAFLSGLLVLVSAKLVGPRQLSPNIGGEIYKPTVITAIAFPNQSLDLDRQPISIKPIASCLVPVSDSFLNQTICKFTPPTIDRVIASDCLHLMRVRGTSSSAADVSIADHTLLESVTSIPVGTRVFDGILFSQTRYGVRFFGPQDDGYGKVISRARESHRDQCLASFAELGFPLSAPLHCENGDFRLIDALKDSVATFQIDQRELEWTAAAYALYLPPLQKWHNAQGQEFSFDDIVSEIISRGFQKASCGGTHRLFSLILIARVDEQIPILSENCRLRLRTILKECVAMAIESQDSDGSWPLLWHPNLTCRDYGEWTQSEDGVRLLITGHLTECLCFAPSTIRVPEQTLTRAVHWLVGALQTATVDQIHNNICPYTHALCAVRSLVGSETFILH
jgi:hypothetical protein